MTVRRKLFLAMAAFIFAMSALFVIVTHFVVRATLEHIRVIDRSEQLEQLTSLFIAYDKEKNGVWEQDEIDAVITQSYDYSPNETILLQTQSGETLYKKGEAPLFAVWRFGLSSDVQLGGGRTAELHYLDPEVGALSRIQMGIGSSVFVILLASSIIFLLISLLIARWLAKRITRPLGELLPIIDRLGRGELGIQAPQFGKDEYGTVVEAFNRMSLQLSQAEETRRNLVADVSHELRTPLTILRGKLDLIQQNGHSVAPESLLPLQDELLRLSRLIDDLHQLSLAEARKLPLDRKPTDIDALVRKIADRLEDDAESKGIDIVYDSMLGGGREIGNGSEILSSGEFGSEGMLGNGSKTRSSGEIGSGGKLGDGGESGDGGKLGSYSGNIDSGSKVELAIDAFRITQALLNIMVNAMKYTPTGGKVTVRLEPGPAETGASGSSGSVKPGPVEAGNSVDSVRISISDTGPGIEPEHLDRIFDRFYRTDAARNRNSGGMGLGLAIAKGYVEAHDGTIRVFSQPGEGTTFVVTLPLNAAE